MKLHWSPRSPFVRKVMIAAHECSVAERIKPVRTVVAMTTPNADLLHENPLGKIPTLVLDDGTVLYDSGVICEYFDTLHDGPKLFPGYGPAHWTALRRHALGSGLLDLLVLWRNERDRPQPSQPHLKAFAVKAGASFDALEREAPTLAASPFDIGALAIGCALSYADFRFKDVPWRDTRPQLAAWHAGFAQRPSVRATEFVEG